MKILFNLSGQPATNWRTSSGVSFLFAFMPHLIDNVALGNEEMAGKKSRRSSNSVP